MPKITHPLKIDLSPIKYIRSYIGSPGFKTRLNYIHSIPQRKEYYNTALKNINDDVEIANSSFGNFSKYFLGNLVHFLSFGKLIDSNTLNKLHSKSIKRNLFNPSTNIITLDTKQDTKQIVPSNNFVLAHEYGHKVNPSNELGSYLEYITNAPPEYLEIHNRKNTNNKHDSVYMETYSDLLGTRYDLFEKGIFDSRSTQPFTKEHYLKYKEYLKLNKLHNRLMEQFNENDFIKMMNEVAQNNTPTDNQSLYARKGIKLIPRKRKFIK